VYSPQTLNTKSEVVPISSLILALLKLHYALNPSFTSLLVSCPFKYTSSYFTFRQGRSINILSKTRPLPSILIFISLLRSFSVNSLLVNRPEAELVVWSEGKTGHRDKRAMSCSGGVRELGMCGHSPRENRETSGRNLRGTEAATTEATGKASSHTPVVVSPVESVGNIVPGKLANNGTLVLAESMEGRTPA